MECYTFFGDGAGGGGFNPRDKKAQRGAMGYRYRYRMVRFAEYRPIGPIVP